MWYNKDTEREKRGSKMKYCISFEDNKYFPTYFKTKKEAVEFQQKHGGKIQKKIGGNWFDC